MTDPNSILQNLKVSGNLPSMPQVLVQLIDACHRREVNLQEVAEIVEKDAALSAKILQLVNSAFIGARNAFTDTRQAVIYLGANTVKNLAISVSVQQVFRKVKTRGLLSIDRFWYHSCQNAVLAQKIAQQTGYETPAEAYLAGLLHDIGKLLLWMAFQDNYAPLLLKGVRCHGARLSFLEQQKLHINHCEAGGWLAEEWHLPPLLADAIRYHHHQVEELKEGLPLVRITYLADLLSHVEEPDEECETAADLFFGLNSSHLRTIVLGVEDQVAEIAGNMGIRIPKNHRTSMESDRESEEAHRETSRGLLNRVRDITQITGLLDNLLQAEDREQIVTIIEQGLKILFNESSHLLLLFDADQSLFRGVVPPENPLYRDAGRITFHLPRHRDSLVGQAATSLRIRHSFMGEVPEQGRKNLLDVQLTNLLGRDGLVVVPMSHQQELVGLMVIGVHNDSHQTLLGQSSPLQLFARQAAASLYLENQQRRHEEHLVTERLKSATLVARKIGHEINNPLGIIRNYVKILSMKLKDETTLQEELAIIDAELDRVGRIVRQLRDLSQDSREMHPTHLDIGQVLADSIRFFEMSLPDDNRIRIVFQEDDTPCRIRTDGNFLRQIILNLLGNAADAMDNAGTITVSMKKQDNKPGDTAIHIRISDNGPGIPADLLPTIFQPGVSTKTEGHSGLGLAIVQKLLGRLGGSITCTSTDQGTTFDLVLPDIRT